MYFTYGTLGITVVPTATQGDCGTHCIPVDLVFSSFSAHKEWGKKWTSPPFCTHRNGYTMKLVIASNTVLGVESHLPVHVYLAKGEHDDEVVWPFRGSVTFQLLDHTGKRHIERTAPFSGYDLRACSRVTTGELAEGGYGDSTLISYSELTKSRAYLQDDQLTFRVASAVVYSSPELPFKLLPFSSATSDKCIHSFLLSQYTLHKYQNDSYDCPPFYTHHHGYKMHISVFANGCLSAEGTHLSVSAHLWAGEYDSELSWPFQGKITLQMVNWLGDHSHVTHAIDFSRASRRRNKRLSGKFHFDPYGLPVPRFLDHITLASVSARSPRPTKYLHEDCVQFRVISIDFPID